MSEELPISFNGVMEQASAELDAHPFFPDETPAAKPETTQTTSPEGTTPETARVKGSFEVAKEAARKAGQTTAAEGVPAPEAQIEADSDPAVQEALNLAEFGEKLVMTKVDGQEKLVPLKEALAGYSRTQKFTKEMQELRAKEAQVEANASAVQKLQDERNAMLQLVSSQDRLKAYMQQAFGQVAEAAAAAAPADAFGDPDDIITVAQARQLAQGMVNQQFQTLTKQMSDLRVQIGDELKSNTKELQDRQEVAKYSESISTALTEIFEAHPVLKGDSFAEDILRFEVSKMKPKSVEEAVEAFRTVAQARAESLSSHFTDLKKVQVAKKAKLDKAIEPAGGTGPQMQPFDYHGKDGKVDWNKLKSAAKEMLG